MELIDKQKLLEVLDEEIYVYSPDDGINPDFDKGVLYIANKLKGTINLHVFDDHSTQAEIAKLKEERDRIQATLMEVEKAKIAAHNQWWAVREERNALLEGLKHISTITERQWCMDDPIEIARSIIAKIEITRADKSPHKKR